MTLLVAIPCLDQGEDASENGLETVLEMVRAATDAEIHVFFPPGRRIDPPAGVMTHTDPLPDEPDTPFPAGWRGAVRVLARQRPGAAVLVVRPVAASLNRDLVARAAQALTQGPFQAVAAMTPSRDHPCQWEEFFDVLASRAYVPVDDEAQGARELLARAVGASGPARVSLPVRMPSSAPWPQGDFSGRVLEWLPDEGVLLGSARASHETGRDLGDRVFLVLEEDGRVRQAAFSACDLAALPLFCPVGRAEAVFLRGAEAWDTLVSSRVRGACRYHLFGLPTRDAPRGEGDPGGLFPVRSEKTVVLEGRSYVLAGRAAPLARSRVAVFNLLAQARLPKADIAVPFETPRGGWWRDDWNMATRNTGTGECIRGRQSFPEVYEPEGSLVGFRGPALESPEDFLAGGGEVFPLVIDQARARLAREGRVPTPVAIPTPGEEPERTAPDAFEHPGLREFLHRRAALDATLARASQALDTMEADPASPDPSGRAACEADLIQALRLLADVADRQAALTLERATVAQAVADYDERAFGLLPLRVHTFHQSRSFCRRETLLDEKARQKPSEELLALWVRSRGGDVARGYAALRDQALALGLSPVWSADIAVSLAVRGWRDQALELVGWRYAGSPWLRDEHSRIGALCLRPVFLFDQYLDWMERDASPGRMSARWTVHLCEALAVCRRDREAHAVAEAAYARYPYLYNLHAVTSLWRFQTRDYDMVKALPGFERDARQDRLTGIFVILHAAALAAAGRWEEAADTVERAYAKDNSVGNGFAMIGWHGDFVQRRDAEAALLWFERDRALGRLDISWKGYEAALCAFQGDLDRASALVEEVYAYFPAFMGLYAQVGLMRWLRERDLDACLAGFSRDAALGRLENLSFQLACRAVFLLAGRPSQEPPLPLLDSVGPTVMSWDLCMAWLRLMGLRDRDLEELMPESLRERFLAQGMAGPAKVQG